MMIDDVRLFRSIDTWLRTEIYKNYHLKTKKYLRKSDLLKIKDSLKSVEKTYYEYKKQEKAAKKIGYCECERYYDKYTKTIVVRKDTLTREA